MRSIGLALVGVLLYGAAWAQSSYTLIYSLSPDRSSPMPLAGAKLHPSANFYIFTSPDSGIRKIVYRLDGATVGTKNSPPWDLAGTAPNGYSARPFSTARLRPGQHSIAQKITLTGGAVVNYTSVFRVCPRLTIAFPSALPGAQVGKPYSGALLQATGGSDGC